MTTTTNITEQDLPPNKSILLNTEQLINIHQDFLYSLLNTLNHVFKENSQYLNEINLLSAEFQKSIESALHADESNSLVKQSKLRMLTLESNNNPIIKQIQKDTSDLKIQVQSLKASLDSERNRNKNLSSALNQEITKLNNAIKDNSADLNSHKDQISTELQKLTDRAEEQNTNIILLKKIVKKLNSNINSPKSPNSSYEFTDSSLMTTQNSNADDLAQKVKIIQKRLLELPQMKSDIDHNKKEIEFIKTKSELTEKHFYDSLKDTIDNQTTIQTEIQLKDAQISKLKSQTASVSNQPKLIEQTSEINNIKNHMNQLKEEIQVQLNEIKQSISSQKSDESFLKQLKTVIKDYQSFKKSSKQQFVDISESIEKTNSQLQRNENAINQNQIDFDNNVQKYRLEINKEIQEIYEFFEAFKNELNEQFDGTVQKNSILIQKVQYEVEQLKTQKCDIENLNSRLQSIQTNIDSKIDLLNTETTNKLNEQHEKSRKEIPKMVYKLAALFLKQIKRSKKQSDDNFTEPSNLSLSTSSETPTERSLTIEDTNNEKIKLISNELEAVKNELNAMKKKIKSTPSTPSVTDNDDEITKLKNKISILENQQQQINESRFATKKDFQKFVQTFRQISDNKVGGYASIDVMNPPPDEMTQMVSDVNQKFEQSNKLVNSLQHDIRCLKFEVKRLKHINQKDVNENPIDLSDQKDNVLSNEGLKNMIQTTQNDFQTIEDEIMKLKLSLSNFQHHSTNFDDNETKADDKKSGNQDKRMSQEDIITRQQVITHSLKALIDNQNQQMKCLKYEVKKLKENIFDTKSKDRFSLIENVQNKLNSELNNLKSELLSIKTDKQNEQLNSNIINRIENIEQLISKNEQQQTEFKCMKYEVKKLKKKFAAIQTIQPNCNETTETVNSNQNDNSELLTRIDNIEQQINSQNELFDLKSMKYEIEKLKEKVYKEVNSTPINSNENELNNRISKLEQNLKICNQLHNRIETENTHIQNIQTEIKQLKEKLDHQLQLPKERVIQLEPQAPSLNNEIYQIQQQILIKLKCLQYEVKKLKQIHAQENDGNDLQQKIDLILEMSKNNIEKQNAQVKCLKYEVKKLKNAVNPNHSKEVQSENVSTLMKQFELEKQNQLDQFTKQIESLQHEVAKQKPNDPMNDGNNQIQIQRLRSAFKCLKFEVKKLKNNSNIQERNLVLEQRESDSPPNIENEAKLELKSLKFEIKKLKETIQQFDNDTKLNQLESQIRQLTSQIQQIQNQIDKSNKDSHYDDLAKQIKVIKDELGSLKQTSNHNGFVTQEEFDRFKQQQIKEIPQFTQNDELLHTLESQEKQVSIIAQTYSLKNELNTQIASLKSELREKEKQQHHSIRCLKYEMKKMKENLIQFNENKSKQNSLDEEQNESIQRKEESHSIQRIEQEVKELKDTFNSHLHQVQEEVEQMSHIYGVTIKCLKHEVKKLKSNETVLERSIQLNPHIENLENIGENQPNKANDQDYKLKCLKYEVKKLKESHSQINSTLQFSLKNNEIDTINSKINNLTNQINDHQQNTTKILESIEQELEILRNSKFDDNQNQFEISKITESSNKKINEKDNNNEAVLKCLKHEMKKLKFEMTKLRRIENKAQCEIKESQHSEWTNQIEKLTNRFNESEHRTKRIFGCLKHEVKKVQFMRNKSENRDEVNEIQKEIQSIRKEIEKNDSNDKVMKSEIKCLKYEVKKLKEIHNTSTPNDLIEERSIELNGDIKTPNNEEIAIIKKQIDELSTHFKENAANVHDILKCLKHEVKTMKTTQMNRNYKEAIPASISTTTMNDTEAISILKQEINDLTTRLNEHEEHQKEVLRCLKHEVKKAMCPNAETQLKEFNDQISALHHQVDSIISQEDYKQYQIRCLKYEVKKLKETRLNPQETDDEMKSNEYTINNNELAQHVSELSNRFNENQQYTKEILRCLKYEVKKLKENAMYTENEYEYEYNDNDGQGFPPEIEEVKKAFIEIEENTDQAIQCLKDEISKLESTSIPVNQPKENAVQEQINTLQTELTTLRNEFTRNEELVHQIRCLKYEVKKLKENAMYTENEYEYEYNDNYGQDFPPEIEEVKKAFIEIEENTDQAIQCLKDEISRLSNQELNVSSRDNLRTSNDLDVISKQIHHQPSEFELRDQMLKEIRCLKYEVKKLKEISIAQGIAGKAIHFNYAEIQPIIENILHQIKQNEQNINESLGSIKTEIDQLELNQNQLKGLQNQSNEQISKDIRCMKYEVKKLKEHSIEEGITERAINLNDAELPEENNEIINLRARIEALSTSFSEEIKNNQEFHKCIKYELKKLQENASQETDDEMKSNEYNINNNEIAQQISELINRFNENERNTKEILRCLKHELKQLKLHHQFENIINPNDKEIISGEQEDNHYKSSSKADFSSNEQIVQEIKCLKYEVKKLKEHSLKAETSEREIELTDNNPEIILVEEVENIEIQPFENQHTDNENEHISQLISEVYNLQSQIKCLKYEVKKLKENSIRQGNTLNLHSIEPSANPAMDSEKEIDDRFHNLNDQISTLINEIEDLDSAQSRMKCEFKCLKYAVKKLKNNSELTNSNLNESNPENEEICQIKKQIFDLANRLIENEHSNKRILGCIKHELKNIRSNEHQNASNIIKLSNEMNDYCSQLNSLENELPKFGNMIEEIESQEGRNQYSLRCLKHEVKKFKDITLHEHENSITASNQEIAEVKKELGESEIRFNETRQNVNSVLSCLKHEIIKLRVNTQSSSTKQSDQINEIEQQLKVITSQYSNIRNEIEFKDQMLKEIRCLKYEVKKLKEHLFQGGIIGTEINITESEPYQNNEEISSLKGKIERLSTAFNEEVKSNQEIHKCIKHELKKLQITKREEQRTTDQNDISGEFHYLQEEISSLRSEFESPHSNDELNSQIRCLKYEVKKLKEARLNPQETDDEMKSNEYNINNNELAQQISELANRFNENERNTKEILQCLKHELKQLKLHHQFENIINPNDKEIISGEQEDNHCKSSSKADFSSNEQIVQEIKCLKYEVKKLKERSMEEGITERAINLNDNEPPNDNEEISELHNRIDNLSTAFNEEVKSNNEVLKCMKHELKKLQGNTTPNESTNNDQFTKSEALINMQKQISNITNQIETHAQVMKVIKCLKYEVKKLKEFLIHRGIMERTIRLNDAEIQAEIDDLKEQFKEKEQTTKDVLNSIKAEIAQLTINENQFSPFMYQTDGQISKEIKCLKYEVKKLKEQLSIEEKDEVHEQSLNLQMKVSGQESELKNQIESMNTKFAHEIRCLKYEMKKLKSNMNLDEINQRISSIQSNLSQVFNQRNESEVNTELDEIINMNVDYVSNIQNDLKCIKYEMKKLKNYLSPQKNAIENDIKCLKYELKKMKTFLNMIYDVKSGKCLNENQVQVLQRILNWNYENINSQVYINSSKDKFIPCQVFTIFETLIELSIFDSTKVNDDSFNQIFSLFLDEYKLMKLETKELRFLCAFYLMKFVNQNDNQFDDHRIKMFNTEFSKIVNFTASQVLSEPLRKLSIYLNRLTTGSFYFESLNEEFTAEINQQISSLKYNSETEKYLKAVLISEIDTRLSNKLILNSMKFNDLSISQITEFLAQFEYDLSFSKEIMNCMANSNEILNDESKRAIICQTLSPELTVFLLKNNKNITIDKLKETFGVDIPERYGPIPANLLLDIDFEKDSHRNIDKFTNPIIDKNIINCFPYLRKYQNP